MSIAQILIAQGATLATAESCTGGRIASLLTRQAGASEWYVGGVVAYSRLAKKEVLGLTSESLSAGTVSEKCARGMARHAALLLNADYAVATTGVCGPSECEGFPPCYVWVAVKTPRGISAFLVESEDKGREGNIDFVAAEALRLLQEEMER
ncbi:CinA family protein [Porphyromonas levii]|uniref:CinA family protein n=1 Tax=Porphyromonas levii TaxID=28114 RepID=A0A4Y8WRY6_9PORP|nr:CinA family protein [Porphyromonas levii]MBR8703848.1 putative competence-damage inducible protein [Porphyromonas levii]MBR8713767.1 putative competence-damage inducible protein [Porphyromonas levii]MBR8715780.1 putative competence-damage inducible protein [Porphyromonas levii]MBR8728328.1 putative competence-damage inducible protein [Porphyromonas levii]MBR8729377.1 putative competence-damage inducible protein [Porphyromonas levii]